MGNYSINGVRQMATENELAVVLSNFNTQYIYDAINNNLDNKFNISASTQLGNIVQAYNQSFKNIRVTYPSDNGNVDIVETETYREIVQIICAHYGIDYQLPAPLEGQVPNYFPVAFYMYDFLVSNFFNYIGVFYARYIYSNKDHIYDAMDLEQFKKNKDSSTLYGKKVYADPKIAIISANIMYIVKNLQSFDISIENILTIIYGQQSIVNMLAGIINNVSVNFFKVIYQVPPQIEAILYTNIRLELQRLSMQAGGVDFKIS